MELFEVESKYYSSYSFDVSVKKYGYSGSLNSIWIDRDAIEAFLLQLTELSTSWKGMAILTSMDYKYFTVSIEIVGLKKDIVLNYQFVKSIDIGPSMKDIGIYGGFQIEATSLDAIMNYCKKILNCR
ncbi:hypothetical protein ACFMB7_27105 [Bacillus toyonensis]